MCLLITVGLASTYAIETEPLLKDQEVKSLGPDEKSLTVNESQDLISQKEEMMESLFNKMITIAVEIDPALAAKKIMLQTAIVERKLNQYSRMDKAFGKLLPEYRRLQNEVQHLKDPGLVERLEEQAELNSRIPYPDVNALPVPKLPESIRNKKWTWDKINRYISIHKRGAFTEDEIKTIASFDMIHLNSDKDSLDLARALKIHNPNMICIGYRNVIIWHESFNSDLFREHPDWFMKHFQRGTYETHGRTGPKAKKPLFDFRVPEMRDWWIQDIGRQCDSNELDGVLIDAFAKILTEWGPKRRSIGWDPKLSPSAEYSQLFLDKILLENIKVNGGKGLIIANALRSGYDNCLKSYVDVLLHGSYMEWIEGGQEYYEEGLSKLIDTLIQIGKDPGDKFLCFAFGAHYPPPPKVKVNNANNSIPESTIMPGMGEHFDAKGKTHEDIVKEMREAFSYKLAIFLICANKYSYMAYGSTMLANDGMDRWAPKYPEHNKKIGMPLGHAVKKGTFYYEREFEHVSVKLNVETRQAVLNWK